MKDHVKALLGKAEQYLRSATLLRTGGDYDSAILRLYYTMFYCAEALLLTKGLTFSRHKGVITSFGKQFVKTGELPPAITNGYEKHSIRGSLAIMRRSLLYRSFHLSEKTCRFLGRRPG